MGSLALLRRTLLRKNSDGRCSPLLAPNGPSRILAWCESLGRNRSRRICYWVSNLGLDASVSHVAILRELALLSRRTAEAKHFYLAAEATRADGVTVRAVNGRQPVPAPAHHAEARLCRKLTPTEAVYVARTTADGAWAMSRPCPSCMRRLRSAGVERVYYTTGPGEYECHRLR